MKIFITKLDSMKYDAWVYDASEYPAQYWMGQHYTESTPWRALHALAEAWRQNGA